MKAFRIFFGSIKESFKGVFRNFSLSFASISCISITLVLVGFSIILSYNVNSFTSQIEKDMTIFVFLDRKTTEAQIKELDTKFKAMPNIDYEKTKFNSKNSVKEQMQNESDVFESILSQYNDETNPLQDTYLVKVVDIEQIGETADEIKKMDNVDLVKYGEGSVEELVKIFNIVEKIAYIAVIILVFITAFLITNTIKITIQSRRREIEIRRLVGASNTFIKQPFFFEGMILGFLGSIVPAVACCYGYYYLYEKLGGQLFTAIIKLVDPSKVVYIVLIVIFVIGIAVGALGSERAVRKYLKI